jgi:hypothetical protein
VYVHSKSFQSYLIRMSPVYCFVFVSGIFYFCCCCHYKHLMGDIVWIPIECGHDEMVTWMLHRE